MSLFNFIMTLIGRNTATEPVTKVNLDFGAISDFQHDTDNINVLKSPRQWQNADGIAHLHVNYPNTQFLLHAGDLADDNVNDKPNQYDEITDILNIYPKDKISALGNHDIRIPYNAGDVPIFYSKTPFIDFDNLHIRGYGHTQRLESGLHIIVLNNLDDFSYADSTGNYKISSTQITWLQSVLDGISEKDARIQVMIHAPFKTNNLAGADPEKRLNSATQSDQVIDMLIDWQKASNYGLVLPVIAGHTHIDGYVQSSTTNGLLDHITLDVVTTSNESYPSELENINSPRGINTFYMAYAHFFFDEFTKILTVTGVGNQDSYSIDMSSRITASGV